jgi:two-component system cell cycle response regulator
VAFGVSPAGAVLAGWICELTMDDKSVSARSVFDLHHSAPSIWILESLAFALAVAGVSLYRERQLQNRSLAAGSRLQSPKLPKDSSHSDELAHMTELHQSAAKRFEELFQGLPVACFTYDSSGTIFECNRECERLVGMPAHEIQLNPAILSAWRGMDSGLHSEILSRVFAGESVDEIELRTEHPDGTVIWTVSNTFPLKSTKGTIPGAICTMFDITRRKRLESQIEEQMVRLNEYAGELESSKQDLEVANGRLQELAVTDSLTGLANRRSFREALDSRVEEAKKTGTPLSVVLFDVDKFKDYNDTYGHGEGDRVLSKVGEILTATVRMGDLPVRYGGEEFVVLLPGADVAQATAAAERLRTAIESASWDHRPVTASFGVSTGVGGEVDARLAIEQADAAMYFSKRSGRNRVTHYWSIPPGATEFNAA